MQCGVENNRQNRKFTKYNFQRSGTLWNFCSSPSQTLIPLSTVTRVPIVEEGCIALDKGNYKLLEQVVVVSS